MPSLFGCACPFGKYRDPSVSTRTCRVDTDHLGYVNCQSGEADCNFAAREMRSQLEPIVASEFDWGRYPLHVHWDRGMHGPYYSDNSSINSSHVQGFVKTNAFNGEWFYAFSHSEFGSDADGRNGNGSISFAKRFENGEKWVEYLFETPGWHPSSLAQIGKYVLWVGEESNDNPARVLKIVDITKLDEYAGCEEAPCMTRASNTRGTRLPSLAIPGIGTGGGGVAIAKLANGEYLLAVGPSGGNSGVHIQLLLLSGDLGAPTSLRVTRITDDELSFDGSDPRVGLGGLRPVRDENLSLIVGDSGRLYLYMTSPRQLNDDAQVMMYFFELAISEVATAWDTRVRQVAAAPTTAIGDSRWFHGGTSAAVDRQGVLRIMAAGKYVNSRHHALRFEMHPCDGSFRTQGFGRVLCNSP